MESNMETVGFVRETAAEAREAREALYADWKADWKAEGSEGLARYTTHINNDPKMVYVVTRRIPMATVPSTEVPLAEPAASDMLSEGGNADENAIAVPVSEEPVQGQSAEPPSEGWS
jgi:hypothetical protein